MAGFQVLTCSGCGAAAPAERFEPIDCACASCRQSVPMAFPIDGAVRTPLLSWAGVLASERWISALVERTGELIAGACPACEGPLMVRKDEKLRLRCSHCAAQSEHRADGQVADALPAFKVDSRTWDGGVSLVWTPAHLEAAVDRPISCPRCGSVHPPFEGVDRCSHCQTPLLALLSCGRRVLPGVRLEGFDGGVAVDQWLPLPQAFEELRKRRVLVRQSWKETWVALTFFIIFVPTLLAATFAGVLIGMIGGNLTVALVSLVVGGVASVGFVFGLASILIHRARRRRAALVGKQGA